MEFVKPLPFEEAIAKLGDQSVRGRFRADRQGNRENVQPIGLAMMDEKSLTELAHEIMTQGIGESTAWHYAALIGDLPLKDKSGNIIVRENGREIATLKPLKIFSR